MTFLCLSVKAQIRDTIPLVDGLYEYQQIIIDSSVNKGQLFKRAKMYFVDNFKNANDVIQYQDENEGKIIGKGNFSVSSILRTWGQSAVITYRVDFSTEIICKDFKYKYRIYNVTVNGSPFGKPQTDLIKQKNVKKTVDELFNRIVENLKENGKGIQDYMKENKTENF